jgi:uncharacterized OB-fold protein
VTITAKQIPIVNYLDLSAGRPALIATVCEQCDASYFGQRIACSRCGGRKFRPQRVADAGYVRSFTIIHRGAATIPTPYVSAVIVLDDGVAVKANVLGCPPDPDHVRLGMRVRLTTYVAGTDDSGTEAVAFGYTPIMEEASA